MADQTPGHADECIANIGERGARRRRASGVVWAVIGAVVLACLLLGHAPRWDRAVLVIPFALAAIGFLQAREKT